MTPGDVLSFTQSLYAQSPSWVDFYREVFGLEGAIAKTFPGQAARLAYESSADYREIQGLLAQLRKQADPRATLRDPQRVVTVRMPKSLHETLKVEAKSVRTSMNKLCISKLLSPIDAELVPADAELAGQEG